ncbi:MAG: ribonuclease M5 [Streptococcaceae bacterium]|jgi:ribonuclease M5|nr:ribonuclease M5 [Streptococcaceae bacterium]
MIDKLKISEVLVVEGKADTANLRQYYDVDTYETQGSAISEEDLERIERLNELRGVIVFTDPDYSGERIRRIVMTAIPTVKHAFLNRSEARPKSKTKGRSLGVEHASFADIQKALGQISSNFEDDRAFDITHSDLIRLGLIGHTDSRQRREYLGERLRIGYSNAKQQLKRLELFGITLRKVEKVMEKF